MNKQVTNIYKNLLTKLGVKNMTTAKDFNDVYGQVELDYAREFDEGNIEQQAADYNAQQLNKEFTRVTSGGR